MTTRDIALVALFAAITATLGLFPPLTIPLIAVPITAQTLGPMLAGSILGARRGALAMVVFAVLVLAGLPLLAGGRGGLGILAGPTGGFFVGWPFAAALIGALHERLPTQRALAASITVNCLGGIVVIYAIGIPWLAAVAHLPLGRAATGSLLFVPVDVIKAVLAALVADTVRRAYPVMLPSA